MMVSPLRMQQPWSESSTQSPWKTDTRPAFRTHSMASFGQVLTTRCDVCHVGNAWEPIPMAAVIGAYFTPQSAMAMTVSLMIQLPGVSQTAKTAFSV